MAGENREEVGSMSWGGQDMEPGAWSLEPRTSICGIISMSEVIRSEGEFKAITCLHTTFSCYDVLFGKLYSKHHRDSRNLTNEINTILSIEVEKKNSGG